MDFVNPDTHSAEGRFSSQVTSDGLILWRLASPVHPDLWCMVFELPDGFHFVVDDDPQGPKPSKLHEHHTAIINVVERAEALKASLVERGWKDVDIE